MKDLYAKSPDAESPDVDSPQTESPATEQSDSSSSHPSRRSFLRSAGGAGLGLISASVTGLVSACDTWDGGIGGGGGGGGTNGGYGPLVTNTSPATLPEGFQLNTFGAIGDEMSDGNLTPIAHDGMAAFTAANGNIRLVRNHEDRNGVIDALDIPNAYDESAGAGCVTLEVDPQSRELVRDFVSLSGTTVNCAGGPTPWGTWLSCEETTVGLAEGYQKPHGYIFEVPAAADGPIEAVPLKAMGRFAHEAVAIDPATGILYLTEDGASGFYRFLPNNTSGYYGSLREGGQLQQARVRSESQREMFHGTEIGRTFEIDWVDIENPDPDPQEVDNLSAAVFLQGYEQGAARFDRLEGCWYGDGNIFFHDTSGGAADLGQVWQYIPSQDKLILVFESPNAEVLDSPDNLTVSPRGGGLVMCEDGGGADFVRGLSPDGEVFSLAKNVLNESEWAGCTFSPDGQTLFVNIQGTTGGRPEDDATRGQGMTVAIWGPWERGSL